jgi:hypothetical protein
MNMNKFATQLQKKYKVLSVEYPYEQAALSALAVIFVLCLLTYVYFVSASVLNVMAQREADRNSQLLEGEIGKLEQQYFALSHAVTAQNAQEIGLVPIQKTAYVYRPGAVGVVSVSSNAI